jgi:RNase P/RNase MRP subunit POP5
MMTLLPKSAREKNRYIVFKIHCEHKPVRKDVVNAIVNSQIRLYGEVGAATQNMWVMDYEQGKKAGIVKCNHKSVRHVKASLALIDSISKKPVAVEVVKTCGTLKKARSLI